MVTSETAKCDLMHAYKLQDYDVEEWLKTLWESSMNSSFKSQIVQVPVI